MVVSAHQKIPATLIVTNQHSQYEIHNYLSEIQIPIYTYTLRDLLLLDTGYSRTGRDLTGGRWVGKGLRSEERGDILDDDASLPLSRDYIRS